MSASSSTPVTIWDALKHCRLPDGALSRYQCFIRLAKHILGEQPSVYRLACISEGSMNTHIGLFGRSFHLPSVDFGLSTMTTDLRRTAMLVSSFTFDCSYCVAHACTLGDMFRGSVQKQIQRGRRPPSDTLNPDDSNKSAAEKATIRLAKAASGRRFLPSTKRLAPLIADVEKELGTAGLEGVLGTVCFTGCLNTVMDVLGAELEQVSEGFTNKHLESVGIQFEEGIHKSSARVSEKRGHLMGGFPGVAANAVSVLKIMPDIAKTVMLERNLYSGIPSTLESLDVWLAAKLGDCVPVFASNIVGVELKRAVCFGLRETMLPEGNENGSVSRVWNSDEKWALMYTYADLVGCDEMKALATGLAMSATGDDLTSAAQGINNGKWSKGFMDARQVVVDQAMKAENVSKETIRQITQSCSPEGIVELATLIGWFCYWYRLTILFGNRS